MALPDVPTNPTPTDGEAEVSVLPTLTWQAAGATSCRMYMGSGSRIDCGAVTRSGIGIDASGTNTFDRNSGGVFSGPLAQLGDATALSWRIIAVNGDGETEGPWWSFTTESATPNTPSPTGTTTTLVPTLSWIAAHATSFDVYFGTSATPPLVSAGQAGSTYTPAALVQGTVYYFQIVAYGAVTKTGPLWSFTAGPFAPVAAPGLALLAAGSARGVGVYQYAYTDKTAAGESVPSPLATIATGYAAFLPRPVLFDAPFGSANNVAANLQVAAGTALGIGVYTYGATWVTALGETTLSATWTITTSSGVQNTVQWIDLRDLATSPTGNAPPPAGVLSMNLYRGAVNSSAPLKLVANFALNFIDSSYEDTLADGSLGATAPTTNTAGGGKGVTVSAIALGPPGTTQRKVYRTIVNGSQLKLLTTIANNSSTGPSDDSTLDGSLGANAPTVDTSGLG